MKKNFKLEINKPCNENVANMEKVEDGFFCSQCAKNVIDLSSKTSFEIEKFISELGNKNSICARLKKSQLEENYSYNIPEKSNNLKYAAAIAATVILSTNVAGQEKIVVPKDTVHLTHTGFKLGKMIAPSVKIETISFDLIGKLIDIDTNKPLSRKLYPNISIMVEGFSKQAKVNPKTGNFEIKVKNISKISDVIITVTCIENELTTRDKINFDAISNNKLIQNIYVKPKYFQEVIISGKMKINED
jgi:hypothetical protein